MKIDSSKIVRLSITSGQFGTVYCPELNLRFPTVYRIVQSMTREQLDESGLPDEKPFAGMNHYELTEECRICYGGTSQRTAIRTLDPRIDSVSLVIRCHASREAALAYLVAVEDYSGDDYDMANRWYSTEDGIFTLIIRPTKPSWPGPLIIYCIGDLSRDSTVVCQSVASLPDGTLTHDLDF
jgi:hypothetical protein